MSTQFLPRKSETNWTDYYGFKILRGHWHRLTVVCERQSVTSCPSPPCHLCVALPSSSSNVLELFVLKSWYHSVPSLSMIWYYVPVKPSHPFPLISSTNFPSDLVIIITSPSSSFLFFFYFFILFFSVRVLYSSMHCIPVRSDKSISLVFATILNQ